MMRSVCGCLVLLFGATSATGADPPPVKTAFDLIPVNAAAAFAVHNLEELKTEGDEFIKNTGLEKHFSIRPSQLLDMAFGILDLNRGRDDSRPAGIFLANLIEARVLAPSRLSDIEKLLVVSVGFVDRDQIASNFGLAKGELQPEQMTKVKPRNSNFGKFIYAKGDHLYLGDNERAILSVAQGKPLSEALTKSQIDRLKRSDMLLHLGTTAWGAGWAQVVQKIKERAQELKGDETDPNTGLSKEMLELISESLPALQNTLLGVAIDEAGLEAGALVIFRPDDHPAAAKFLELLRSGNEASSLLGLPRQTFIASQAMRSDGSKNRALVRSLLHVLWGFQNQNQNLIAVTDRPEFVGLFDEVWQRLKGSRFAVYKNQNPAEEGLYSIVAILDTADPKEFLDEMRQLSRFAKPGELKLEPGDAEADDVAAVEKLIKGLGDPSFKTRQSASLKLRLIGSKALPYIEKAIESPDREVVVRARRLKQQIETAAEARRRDVVTQTLLGKLSARWGDFPAAETRQGVPIDIVKMDLEDESKTAEVQLKEAFGPEWSKIRLAVQGQKIVVLLGSNAKLLDETLSNLKGQTPGLAEHPDLKEFHRRAPESRRAEFHVTMKQFAPPSQEQAPKEADTERTSLSLGVDQDTLELHLWIPNSEMRAVSRLSAF